MSEGHANLVFKRRTELVQTGGEYSASLEVRNEGERAGFIAFSASRVGQDIQISPSVAIIEPGAATRFDFLIEKNVTSEFVNVYSGDEVVRQLKAAVSPNDFFAVAYRDIQTTDELEGMVIDTKLALETFADHISTAQIELYFVNTSFVVSPNPIVCSPGKKSRLSLLNLSMNPIEYTASCRGIKITPKSGTIQPYKDCILNLETQKQITGYVEFTANGVHYMYPVNQEPQKSEPQEDEELSMIGNDALETYIEQSYLQSFFNNDGDSEGDDIERTEITGAESLIHDSVIDHESNNTDPSDSHSSLEDPTDDKEEQSDDKEESTCKREERIKTIEFPPSTVGRMMRAKMRIYNYTEEEMTVTIEIDSSSPFKTSYKQVIIEPRSFVKVPICFISQSVGAFESECTIIYRTGHRQRVRLTGRCTEE